MYNKLKAIAVALTLSVSACGSVPDTAQDIALLQITYTAAANAAATYLTSGAPISDTTKADILKANEAAHSAVAAAVSSLAACPVANNKFDSSCANGAAVVGAFDAAKSAVTQLLNLVPASAGKGA